MFEFSDTCCMTVIQISDIDSRSVKTKNNNKFLGHQTELN